jgi:hypothetical protein
MLCPRATPLNADASVVSLAAAQHTRPSRAAGSFLGRFGEGFRMPATSNRSSGCGPAYGNRPCTNPPGSGAAAMGIYKRRGGEGGRMITGLPFAFGAER